MRPSKVYFTNLRTYLEDEDTLAFIHPDIDWLSGSEHVEKPEIGTQKYNLIEI